MGFFHCLEKNYIPFVCLQCNTVRIIHIITEIRFCLILTPSSPSAPHDHNSGNTAALWPQEN